MKMTSSDRKICAFCARNGLAYEWQALKYDGRRAVIESIDRYQHAATLDAARRLKGIRVTNWFCSAGGVWEGRIYLQDAADAERVEAAINAETSRNEKWWIANHEARRAGMDFTAAANYAEALYPTPATI